MTPAANANADMTAKLETQSRRITALQQQVDAAPAAADVPDLSGLEAGQQQLKERLDALTQQVGSFDARINAIEAQPVAEGGSGGISPSQLNALREIVAAQAERIDALSDEAQQREDAERSSAQQDLRRAALTRIRTALDTGSGFAAALGDLERAGMSAPDALQSVSESGVATQADLQDSFAPAARAALALARKTKSDGETEGSFWAFMSEQLGARSLEPQQGPGADAVLSRAENDVRHGKLDNALREIASLSEPVQAELAQWSATARARMEALAAYDALTAKLN